MSEAETTKNWFMRHVESEAKKDIIPFSESIGEIVGIVIGIIVVVFFVAHQTAPTGFFTSKFGTLEMILFYGPMILGVVPGVLKVLFGRKNVFRPFDISMGVFIAIGIIWLFIVFPFDFAHLADVLPSFLRFLLQWISNDVARVLMVIGMIVAPVMTIYTGILYTLIRRELSKTTNI